MTSSLVVLYIDSALGECADLCSSQHLKVETRLWLNQIGWFSGTNCNPELLSKYL